MGSNEITPQRMAQQHLFAQTAQSGVPHIERTAQSFDESMLKPNASTQQRLMTLSFKEKERQREIDHQNKLLLKQLLKIERD